MPTEIRVLISSHFDCIAVYLSFSPLDIVTDGGWSWEWKYFIDSFVTGTLENFKRAMRSMVKPDGYTVDELKDYEVVQAYEEEYPDIIMIFNETYYDVVHLVALDLDCNVMEVHQALDTYG